MRGSTLTLALAGGVLAASLLLAAAIVLPARPGAALPCRLLPNGAVPLLPAWSPACPLEAYDRVLAFRSDAPQPTRPLLHRGTAAARLEGDAAWLLVSRRGDERWVRVPLVSDAQSRSPGRLAVAAVFSLALLAAAVWIRRSSSARAAGPFLGFSACVGAELVTVLCGHRSHWVELAGVAARGAVPAVLAHLALTFPRERAVLRRFPRLLGGTYGMAALWTLISLVNLYRSAAVWALVDRLVVLVSLAIWGLIVISCALARRESVSTLERARARVLLWGALFVPGIAALAALAAGARASPLALVATLPVPVGYALLRYRLFDLGPDLRRGAAWMVYAAIVAALLLAVSSIAPLVPGAAILVADRDSFFAAALFGFLLGEPLRTRLRRAISSRLSPDAGRLSRWSHDHARQTAELRDPDACAGLLCRTAHLGLGGGGVSVFLAADGGWRLAHARGERAATRGSVAADAGLVARDAELVHLAREDSQLGPEARSLRRAGIEVVAPLRSEGRALGLMLVTPTPGAEAYGSPQLRFMDSLTRQAAISVQNATLTGGLVESGRVEALGRVGAGLAHDLGKPLGVVERLAARLPLALDDPDRLLRDARTIACLAAEVRSTLRRSTLQGVAAGISRLEEVLDGSVRMVSLAHGPGRVAVRLPPLAPCFDGPAEKLTRVLANLLDNALLASSDTDVVEVSVTTVADRLELEVIDRGCGMEPCVARRAFEPFFTTRENGGGSGLGLAICRDLVEEIGGEVSLESAPGLGTRVRIRLPRSSKGRDGAS